MAIKFNYLSVIALLLCIGVMACHPFCNSEVSPFKGQSAFFPEKDSIRIGDTLWFSSSFASRQIPIGATAQVDFSHASNAASELNFAAVTDSGVFNGALDSFSVIPKTGSISASPLIPGSVEEILYQEDAGTYQFECGIIPKKRGIYILSIFNLPSVYKKCTKATVKVSITNADTHISILEALRNANPKFPGVIDNMTRTNSYFIIAY